MPPASLPPDVPAPDAQPTFRALSDPTRRGILRHLAQRDMTIAEVAQNFDMTRAAIKKHLTVLSDGGLITVRARGREKINALNRDGFVPLLTWLETFDQFWDDRLAALKSAIEDIEDVEKDQTHD